MSPLLPRLFGKLRALLNLPNRVDTQVGLLRRELKEHVRDIHRTIKAQDTRGIIESQKQQLDRGWDEQRVSLAALEQAIAETSREVHERLLLQQLQLGRLSSLLDGGSPVRQGDAEAIPLAIEGPDEQPAGPPTIAWEWLHLERCPGCAVADRTIVCEWNKSIVLDRDIFADSPRYNYALCHGCGIVYATCRPVGTSYKALMDTFSETTGRGTRANATNALLNPYPLSEEDRERYRTLIAGGVFISDHDAHEHPDGVYMDRTENAAHVEILAGLLDLRDSRVLEVRSKAGTILSGLRRQFGASVAAMPIFESQQFIVRELYGIECSDLIDYDMFTIPFEGHFDLIACNHMLTHIVRVDRFFDQIRQHMKPGGHLYLYGELNEDDFLTGGKSVISTLNGLHLQAFDRASLIRLLKANGFDTVFVKLRNGTHLCLARYTDDRAWTPLPTEDRNRRVRAYAVARAHAILRAPKAVRSRFNAVWEEALAQGVEAGFVRLDQKGRPRLMKDRQA